MAFYFIFPLSSWTAALFCNTADSFCPVAWSGEALFDVFGANRPVIEERDPHQRPSAVGIVWGTCALNPAGSGGSRGGKNAAPGARSALL